MERWLRLPLDTCDLAVFEGGKARTYHDAYVSGPIALNCKGLYSGLSSLGLGGL
mgnify:CR=1 FL=1